VQFASAGSQGTPATQATNILNRAVVPQRAPYPSKGVVQIRITPKTRNPFTISSLSISGVTWEWHFLNRTGCSLMRSALSPAGQEPNARGPAETYTGGRLTGVLPAATFGVFAIPTIRKASAATPPPSSGPTQ